MKSIFQNRLWWCWVWLLTLSLTTTAIAYFVTRGITGPIAGAAILFLAYMKARLILARYLGLAEAPSWYRGLNLLIAIYMVLLLALYLAAGL
ncbi:cytochrome C oxidase subunit IV family protein [Denitrobaculum tricleocarpae]|uniref:Nitric oxide reductase F protein n=1 Tax=Denitrobaculum tricleocarpae TaxID=2591009 RepID=A0A545TMT1_9PROT|nr:cytochrome C oxidase subunit IV family protein [Denitrobaculum tricleocarpae]TQV78540.1 nitric oxide reductase F protein [Denitrobaculum tricleocarpae]